MIPYIIMQIKAGRYLAQDVPDAERQPIREKLRHIRSWCIGAIGTDHACCSHWGHEIRGLDKRRTRTSLAIWNDYRGPGDGNGIGEA